MLAIVCPGQGSQTPGFLTPWLELDGVREQLSALGRLASTAAPSSPARGTDGPVVLEETSKVSVVTS